jgi:hypothetical protein
MCRVDPVWTPPPTMQIKIKFRKYLLIYLIFLCCPEHIKVDLYAKYIHSSCFCYLNLFNDAMNHEVYLVSHYLMTVDNGLERIWKEQVTT